MTNHESTGGDLWTVPLAGGPPTRHTRLGDTHTLEWSPDGTRLVFLAASAETAGRHQPYILSLADGQVTRVEIDGEVSAATWSPDGARLAINYRSGKRWSIGRMQPDGSDFVDLTPEVTDAFAPVWSPDGQSIAFTFPDGEEVDIAMVPAAGGTVQPFRVPRSAEFNPIWTPDGRSIIHGSMITFDQLVRIDLGRVLPGR